MSAMCIVFQSSIGNPALYQCKDKNGDGSNIYFNCRLKLDNSQECPVSKIQLLLV